MTPEREEEIRALANNLSPGVTTVLSETAGEIVNELLDALNDARGSVAASREALQRMEAEHAEIAMRIKVLVETASINDPVWLLPNQVIFALQPLLRRRP